MTEETDTLRDVLLSSETYLRDAETALALDGNPARAQVLATLANAQAVREQNALTERLAAEIREAAAKGGGAMSLLRLFGGGGKT